MMRWSIIRLIWLRDLRDQLRDRRTLFMIAGLPLLLYPVLGAAVLGFALGFSERPNVIAVVAPPWPGDFPPRDPPWAGRGVVPRVTGLAATPLPGAVLAAGVLTEASRQQFDYPALIEAGRIATRQAASARLQVLFLDHLDPTVLADRKADLVLVVPPDFYTRLEEAQEP